MIHSHNFTLTTMSDKSVETLGVLETSFPFPSNNVDFSLVIRLHRRSSFITRNFSGGWEGGGGMKIGVLGEFRINTKETEEVEYRKVSFSGSVVTTFVAHCIFHVQTIAGKPATDL